MKNWTGRRRVRRSLRRQAGGEVVEFALTLVLYFLILLLVINMAITMFNQGTVNAGARMGARNGSLYWRNPDADAAGVEGRPAIKEAVVDTAVEFYINKILLNFDSDVDLTCTSDSDYLGCTVPAATLTDGVWTTANARDILDSKAVVKVEYPNNFFFDLNKLMPFLSAMRLHTSTSLPTEGD